MRAFVWALLGLSGPAAAQWVAADAVDFTGDPGWWEEPIEAAACGAGWAAVWDVYDSAGVRRAWVWEVAEGVNAWAPLLGGEPGAAAGIDVWGDGAVIATTRYAVSDSTGATAIGQVQGWGGCALPEQELGFLSTYNVLHGVRASGNQVAVVGMSLDPCCVHRELPVLAVLNAEGAVVRKVAVDVAGPALVDTLTASGPLPQQARPFGGDRHDDGGVFYAVDWDGEAVVAAGAYANALHYEVMVVRFTAEGALDAAFGEGGMVRLDVDPGNNTWVESVAVGADGRVQCLVRAHDAGDLEAAFHVLTLDAAGAVVGWASSSGAEGLEAKGMAWGAGAWTAWGADAEGALVGRWEEGGEVVGQTLPEAASWQAARGAWNGEAMAVFGRVEGPVARVRIWHADSEAAVNRPPARSQCGGIHPQPCPAGTLPTVPFPASAWYDLSGRPTAPTAPGWYVVRSPDGTTCPVIFQ